MKLPPLGTPSPAVLYRLSPGLMDEAELTAAKKHFVTYNSRMSALGGDLVIGRYSVLPFYQELENDLGVVGAKLVNTYRQHRYVADLQNYVADLGDSGGLGGGAMIPDDTNAIPDMGIPG
jgi:hypothetical protein